VTGADGGDAAPTTTQIPVGPVETNVDTLQAKKGSGVRAAAGVIIALLIIGGGIVYWKRRHRGGAGGGAGAGRGGVGTLYENLHFDRTTLQLDEGSDEEEEIIV
jgi:hypothetical protein